MSIALRSGGKRHQSVAAGAGDLDQQVGHIAQADGLRSTEIEDLAISRVVRASDKHRFDDVVDVGEVAQLRAVAEDR